MFYLFPAFIKKKVNMKTEISKQELRNDKKKKRMQALAELVKLNDIDKEAKQMEREQLLDEDAEPVCKKVKTTETEAYVYKEPVPLTTEQYVQLKKELADRKKILKNTPRLRLKLQGDKASLSVPNQERTPIFLTDIQHLLMAALLGQGSPYTPWRWCHLEKGSKLSHTVVLVVEGLSLYHFSSHENIFQEATKIFENRLEIVMPPSNEGRIIEELVAVPLTKSQKAELIEKHGSLEQAMEVTQDPTIILKNVFAIEILPKVIDASINLPKSDTFPRTQLLLSAIQLVDEGYPLPLTGALEARYKKFAFTQDVYKEVTPFSPMFGLDCEMCKTQFGLHELARISIVDENCVSVYETLVRPHDSIIDYMTPYSGITSEMMANVTKTLKEVQTDIRKLLPADAILVGQSLNCDMAALQMMHPYIIDTSVIYNVTGERKRKSRLQFLAKEFLGEVIQSNKQGHDSIEDAMTSMKLTKLKLAEGAHFGDAVLAGRKRANEIYKEYMGVTNESTSKKELSGNLFDHVTKKDRHTSVIYSAETTVDYEKYVLGKEKSAALSQITCYKVENNSSAIKKTIEMSLQNALTLTHVKIDSEKLDEKNVEKTLTKVDKWISRLWNSLAPNGMLIVLLGGAPLAPTGVAMLEVKKTLFK